MVSVVVGAVAVGLVSVCAIPLGCFITRRMNRTKARNRRSVGSDEHELEMEPLEVARRREPQPGYEVEEFSSRSCDERVQRFEVRVFISSGSATGSVEFQGGRRGEDPSQDAAAGPATGRRIESASAGSRSAPAVPSAANEGSITTNETTRLEITICGAPPRNAARFLEFKEGLKDATSTPKRRRASWWNPWNRPSGTSTATAREPGATTELEPAASRSEVNSSESPSLGGTRAGPAAGSSGESGEARARGKRGFPHRLLETLRETTSFATL